MKEQSSLQKLEIFAQDALEVYVMSVAAQVGMAIMLVAIVGGQGNVHYVVGQVLICPSRVHSPRRAEPWTGSAE